MSSSGAVPGWNLEKKEKTKTGVDKTPYSVRRRGDRPNSGSGVDRRGRRSEWDGHNRNNNIAAIEAIHTIKPKPSHHIWDLFHRRVSQLHNIHK